MMPLPKITVITVVYNRVNTIEQAISSVVNQTYPNLEYIVIDGGSTDGTVDIIKKYDKQISYWVSEADGGIYDAMNKGVRVATGEYVEFLNSDDCFCSYDILEQVVKELDNQTDVLSCRVCVVDERYLIEWVSDNDFAINKKEYQGGMISHQGMFVTRNLLLKYPFDIKYKIAADYKFFLSCYYDDAVRFKWSHLPVVYFSNGGVSDKIDSLPEQIEISEKMGICMKIGMRSKILACLKKDYETFYRVLRDDCYRKIYSMFRKKHKCNNEICRWCMRKSGERI